MIKDEKIVYFAVLHSISEDKRMSIKYDERSNGLDYLYF